MIPVHPDGRAREGDTITYETIISNATGTGPATGVEFTNPTPANTTAIVGVTVSPLAVNDLYSTTPDTPLNVAAPGVLANDSGQPFPTATAASGSTTPAGSGTYNLAADGSFTYTPPLGFQGTATFTYTATNGAAPPSAGDNTATVTIVVDNAPTVSGTTPADNATNVAGNSDIIITFSEAVNVTGNWFQIVGSSSGTRNPGDTVITGGPTVWTINPNTDFSSTETVTVTVFASQVTDQDSDDPPDNMAANYVFDFAVAADVAPTAVDDAATVAEDSGANAIDVLANDTDPDGGTKSVSSVTQPANGTAAISGGGTGVTYTPNAGYCNDPPGTMPDTFTYTLTPGGSTATVSVTVTCGDDAPVAVDDSATVAEDSGATAIDVLANDTDTDGGTKSVSSVTQPANGTVVITGGGTGVSYQPDANYCNDPPGGAPDTFTYTLNGGSVGTVSVTVTCSDDPPEAVDDAATVDEDATATTIDVLANDTDVDGGAAKSIQSTSDPANGTVVITNSGADLTYTPDANYCNSSGSPDTFTYTLTPGGDTATVSVTVTCVNDAPVVTAGAALNYTENAAATVIDNTITVADADDTHIESATVQISNNYINGQDVLALTPSPQNGITGTFNASNGTLTLSGSATKAFYQTALRSVTYANTSNDPSTLARTVTWIVNDGGPTNPTSAPVTSTINVTAVNDAPTANGFTNLPAQAAIPITYPPGKLGGTDVEAGTTITIDTTPINVTNGTVTINGDGSFVFTPLPNATTASFQYRVSDNGNPAPGVNSAYATVSFTVAGPAIYFVKNPAVGLGNCTLGNECLLATAVANIGAATNARIFISDANSHTGPATLNSGGWVIGQGVTADFDTLFGIDPTPDQGTLAPRPATKASDGSIANPTITTSAASTNGINLNINNTVRGLTVGNTTGSKVFGSSFGILTIGNTSPDVVLTGSGKALDLTSGTFAATSAFNSVATTSSSTQGISLAGVGGTVAFGSTSVSGSTTQGILIGTTPAVINFGNTTVSGGTDGVSFQNNASGTRSFGTLGVSGSSGVAFLHGAGGGNVTVTGAATLSSAGNAVDIQSAAASTAINFQSSASATRTASGGIGVNLASNNASATITFNALSIQTNAGTGLSATGAGTVNVTNATGTINNTTQAAPAIIANGVALNANFASINSSGGANGVSLTNVTGTSNFGTGALSNSTGDTFFVSGQNGSFTYNGTISSGSAHSVNVTGKNGGTVNFGGAITDMDTGITLTTNPGATINFTGGINASTGANAAFTATGGGTVSATQNNNSILNTLTTLTGTALKVENTTIGGANLTFRSISANGAPNGIFLNNTGTSGGLIVVGDGSNTAKGGNATGGTIQNIMGSDGTTNGIAIYLKSTANVVLRRITVSGVVQNIGLYGELLNGFTMQYCNVGGTIGTTSGSNDLNLECPVEFGKTAPSQANGFAGGSSATVDNCLISGGIQHNVEVYQQANTASVTISNSNITANSAALGADGINIETHTDSNGGTPFAQLTVSVQSCLFDNNKSQALQANSLGDSFLNLTVNNCTIQKTLQGNEGFVIQNGGDADLTTRVTNNTFTGILGTNILVGQVVNTGSSLSNLIGVIQDNTMTVGNAVTFPTNRTLIVFFSSVPGQVSTANVLVDGNTINTFSDPVNGIAEPLMVSTPDANTDPSFTATVTDNVVNITDAAGTALRGIAIQSIQDLSSGCVDVRGNDVNYTPAPPAGVNGIRLRQVAPATLQLEQGVSAGSAATVLAANNPLSTTEVVGTVTVVNNNTCQTAPTNPAPLLAAPRGVESDRESTCPARADVRSVRATLRSALAAVLLTPFAAADAAEPPMGQPAGPQQVTLSQAELDATVAVARESWEATGLTPEQAAALRSLSFEVTDLPGRHVGEANGSRIRIDNDAAGNGWNLDASTTSSGRLDLLTAVMHEIGHALGLPDTYAINDREKVMYGFLSEGERRLPTMGDAAHAKPGTLVGPHFLDPADTPVNVGTIPAGKSVAVRFQVTINNPVPSGTTQISSQGLVHSTTASFSDVVTDDPAVGGTTDPTVTEVAVPTRAFSAGDPPDGTVGTAYTYNFVADGNPAPTFAVQSGSLPAGLTLSSGGVLSGTPTAGGTFSNIVVRASNTDGVTTLGFVDTTFDITINPAATTTTIISGTPNPSAFGQSVTFTATVTPSFGSLQPTGTVTFKDGATTLGSGTLADVGGTATASYTTTGNQLPAGSRSITAVYSSDANFAASTSGIFTQTVNQEASTTGVVSNQNPSVFGQSVTFTATVSANAGSGTPTGTVQFVVDGSNLGSPVTLSSGQASVSTSALNVGNHTVEAQYSGDANFSASNSSLTGGQQVNKANTSAGVQSSADPSVFGQSVTFTATIGATAPGSGTPTGTVQFIVDGSNAGGPIALSSGAASFSTSSLSVGNHTVAVQYSGDGNFNTSNGSLSGGQDVTQAATTTSVSSSANPSNPGENVTFTATIGVAAPGAGTPTGTVQFVIDGSNAGGPIALSGNTASFSTSSLSAGNHTVSAQYSGDANFTNSSGSLSGGQTVSAPVPTPTPTPTPTPSPAATPTPTPTPSPGATPTPTATPSATPGATPTPTATPSATPGATPTPTATPSATPGASATPTPTPSATPTATPAQALNISTRLRVDTGDKVMIGGFIIRGNAAKPVVIRGLGPSLVDSNVPAATVLDDPKIELRGPSGALILSNDNWQDSPQKAQIEGTIFEPTDDREAVVLATLDPGNYTAILSGVGGTTGVGLVEIYDNNSGVDSDLANISTRGFVQVADEVMIGGFTLGGNNNPARIAVRARGPSLTGSGLTDVLADPTLELHNANGTIMVSNDDWTDDAQSAADLTANGLALPHPKESGIFTSLAPPGQFTAIVAGKDGGIGIALVEIYDLR